MAEKSKKIEISLEQIEALVPGYRILHNADLYGVARALTVLWQQESRDFPVSFRAKLFVLEQHVYNYLVNKPSPFLPTMAESLECLKKLLPDRD